MNKDNNYKYRGTFAIPQLVTYQIYGPTPDAVADGMTHFSESEMRAAIVYREGKVEATIGDLPAWMKTAGVTVRLSTGKRDKDGHIQGGETNDDL